MIEQTWISDGLQETIWAFLASGSWRGGVVVALALFFAWLWKRRAAADLHVLWLLAVLSFPVLAWMSVAGPEWRILPAPLEAPVLIVPNIVIESDLIVDVPPMVGSPSVPASPLGIAEGSVTVSWWLIAWLTGVGLLAIRWVVGWVMLASLTRHPVAGPMAMRLSAARKNLGIRRHVTLHLTKRRSMPMVCGVRKSRLILPARAWEWDSARLDAVFAHELAHVKRHDPTTQCLVQLVSVIYWFHPLVWLAVWRLATERERACDDAVLGQGHRPSRYAKELMAIAMAGKQSVAPVGSLAMARGSQLESRVRSLLDPRRVRSAMGGGALTVLLVGWVAMVFPLASLRAQVAETVEPALTPDNVFEDQEVSGDVQPPRWHMVTQVRRHLMVELATERANLAALKAVLGKKHPRRLELQAKVTALEAEIAALPEEKMAREPLPNVAFLPDSESLTKRYDQARARLEELKQRYQQRHPKYIQQVAELDDLSDQIHALPSTVKVATPKVGIVKKVAVKVGEKVTAGATLLMLDQRRARLAVESASRKLNLSKMQIERATDLVESGVINSGEVREVESSLAAAEVALKVALMDLEDLTVRAPADGTIVRIDAHAGEYVSPEKPVILLLKKSGEEE